MTCPNCKGSGKEYVKGDFSYIQNCQSCNGSGKIGSDNYLWIVIIILLIGIILYEHLH